jgi:hypothetical protein
MAMSDRLIERLVHELEPVRPLASPLVRAARYAALAVGCVAVAVVLAGPRADLGARLLAPSFLVETGALLSLFFAATLAALASGVPGAKLGATVGACALSLVLWLTAILSHGALAGDALAGGLSCLGRSTLLGLVPGLGLALLLRRAMPLDRSRSGLLAALAVAALAVLGTRALCPRDDALHALAWHFAPVLVAAFLGAVCARGPARSG